MHVARRRGDRHYRITVTVNWRVNREVEAVHAHAASKARSIGLRVMCLERKIGEREMIQKWQRRDQTTIPRMLQEAASKWPERVYLDFSGEKHTFADVEREATRIAHGLLVLGVGPGDRVCMMLDNVADYIFVWYAANLLGAIAVPVNTDMKGEFLRHQIVDAEPSVMFVESHYAERVAAIDDAISSVRTLVVRGALPSVSVRRSVIGIDAVRSHNTHPIESTCQPGDLALLMYTSGTTGPSKGCMISHNQICNFGRRVMQDQKIVADDVYWTPLPLFHVGAAAAAVISTLSAGATASIYPRFSASHFWDEIDRSRANKVLMLSVMLAIIADGPDTEVSKRCYGQIKVLIGAPFPDVLKKKWIARFGVQLPICPAYGSTEVFPITTVSIDTPDVPEGASGQRFEDIDVRILDDDGNECPPRVAGEIVLRPNKPDIMFKGYWRRPEATIEAVRDMWFHTGDMGMFDENGFFFFVDRKKDYLRKGGENISSFEVEATFLTHPCVQEVVAHAVKAELGEDELKVTLALKPGALISEEELCLWSIERLPRYAVPRYIEFRPSLPRTPTGKAQKYLLRDQGVTPNTWDRIKAGVAVPRK